MIQTTLRQLLLFSIAVCSSAAVAADEDDWTKWPMGDKFTVGVGAYWASVDTQIRVDASNGIIGTWIDFEQNLGLDETTTMPAFQAEWRFLISSGRKQP